MIWNALLCSLLLAEFQAANQLYDAGHYAEAAAAYEKIEPKTAHVYFNLGNALFRQEKFGLAVLNYERARRLAPRDPDVLANLKFARQRLGVDEPGHFLRSAVESRTVAEWCRYELGALWLTVLAVAGSLWLPRLRTGLLLVAVAGGLATGVTTSALTQKLRAPPAAIALTRTEARFAPTTDATVHFQLPEGTKVAIRENRGVWTFIERADGQQGWVKSEAIERVGTGAAR
jgi:tetratricopeptide (TPR) repeat protein